MMPLLFDAARLRFAAANRVARARVFYAEGALLIIAGEARRLRDAMPMLRRALICAGDGDSAAVLPPRSPLMPPRYAYAMLRDADAFRAFTLDARCHVYLRYALSALCAMLLICRHAAMLFMPL